MAINPHFNQTTDIQEQTLIEDLVVESIQIHGQDVYYIPRTSLNEDYLFGDDILPAFNSYHIIEMYIKTVDGFEGDGDIMSKFGLEIRDQVSLIVSKRRFTEELTDMEAPRQGDLIYFPLSKGLFEVTFVEVENPFYQLGKLYTYDLTCELFDYSQETLNTGNLTIDDIETDNVNDDSVINDPFADNVELETEADTIKDVTEINVFGDF